MSSSASQIRIFTIAGVSMQHKDVSHQNYHLRLSDMHAHQHLLHAVVLCNAMQGLPRKTYHTVLTVYGTYQDVCMCHSSAL